jgi:SNF2 family DNA or RNA helicase
MLAATSVTTNARTVRGYQKAGIAWLVDGKRKFLTDGFGLGKTSQAIWAASGPTLVACPGHLLNHWKREILACRPGSIVVLANAPTTVIRKQQLAAGVRARADFYVVPIELFRTDMHIWFDPLRPAAIAAGTGIETLIVDEAHRLRGRGSQQTKGATAVAHRVERVYLLTATPVYNTPADLFSTLHILDKARFPSYWQFVEDYLSVMNTGWGPRTLGLRRNRLLKKVFAEYAMGRTRAEVRAQLPALQESLVELEPDRDWYKQYEKIKWNYRDLLDQQLTSTQSVLQNLRGYTQQVKLQAVCELIQDGCAENTLIYTYHRDLAKALGHLLNAPVVTGDLAPAKREEVARGHDFVVATFPSVAEGLDFSHMENIIYVEHDWQPGMLAQSLARVHRPGNDFSNVNVYHVVVKRTVDAVLYNTVKGRGATMQEIVDAALVPFDLGEGENDE